MKEVKEETSGFSIFSSSLLGFYLLCSFSLSVFASVLSTLPSLCLGHRAHFRRNMGGGIGVGWGGGGVQIDPLPSQLPSLSACERADKTEMLKHLCSDICALSVFCCACRGVCPWRMVCLVLVGALTACWLIKGGVHIRDKK